MDAQKAENLKSLHKKKEKLKKKMQKLEKKLNKIENEIYQTFYSD